MRNPVRRQAAAVLTALIAGTSLPALAEEKPVLNFGIISTESSQNLSAIWQPFLQDMERRTGYRIKAFFAMDYAGIVQGMRFGKVDMAWYGNKSAIEAVDRANGEVFARVKMASGEEGYHSVLIAHKDSGIDDLQGMFGRAASMVFGNGDPNSTSGYLVPGYYVFAQNGVDPARAFKRTLNASHEVNALAVANRQVDVATCNSEVMARVKLTNPEKANELKIIWTSPLIPSDPLVWRKDLPEKLKTSLRDFFVHYGATAEEQKLLSALQWSGFKASDNDQLLPIRQLELFKSRLETANSKALDDKEKKSRLARIDQSLEALKARMTTIQAKAADR